jgi:hypothetical protein
MHTLIDTHILLIHTLTHLQKHTYTYSITYTHIHSHTHTHTHTHTLTCVSLLDVLLLLSPYDLLEDAAGEGKALCVRTGLVRVLRGLIIHK